MNNNIIISYKSVKKEALTKEIIINRSRFIGCAKHTMTQEDALKFIDEVNAEHPEASCVCYAYICGMKQEIQKLHDGHEPVGGMPILEILRLKKLTAVCCAVVRYFGGKQLGIGGLARAFSNTAVEAVNIAKPCTYELSKKVNFVFDYSYKGKIDYMLANSEFQIESIDYDSKVRMIISHKLKSEDDFISKISKITNGKHELAEVEMNYKCWE